MKTCTACNKMLPLSSFGKKKHTLADGTVTEYRRYVCRDCTNKQNLERYHGNPNTKSAHRDAAYRYTVKKYGLTVEQHEAMLVEQDYRCFICDTHQDDTRFGKLCIDHCHTTGKVRKLLCSSCNTALGMAKEDISRLYSIISYLEEHKVGTDSRLGEQRTAE